MIDVDWSVMEAHGSGYCFEAVRGEGGGGDSMAMQGAHPDIFKVGSSIKSES